MNYLGTLPKATGATHSLTSPRDSIPVTDAVDRREPPPHPEPLTGARSRVNWADRGEMTHCSVSRSIGSARKSGGDLAVLDVPALVKSDVGQQSAVVRDEQQGAVVGFEGFFELFDRW